MNLYKMKKKKEEERKEEVYLENQSCRAKNLENHNIIFSVRISATMATRG